MIFCENFRNTEAQNITHNSQKSKDSIPDFQIFHLEKSELFRNKKELFALEKLVFEEIIKLVEGCVIPFNDSVQFSIFWNMEDSYVPKI